MELHLWQLTLPLTAVAIAISIGGGLAVWEYIWRIKQPTWFLALMTLPLFLPQPIVGTILIATLGKYHVLYTPAATLFGYAYYNIPLAYVLLSQALQPVPSALLDTLSVFKANRWQQFKLAIWPHLKQPLKQTAAIVFLYCFTSFSLPLMLGGFKAATLEVAMYQQWVLYHDATSALGLAAIQTIFLLLCVYPFIRQQRVWQPAHHLNTAQSNSKLFTSIRWLCSSLLLLPLLSLLQPLQWLLQTRFWPAVTWTLLLGGLAALVIVFASYLLRNVSSWVTLLLCVSPVAMGIVVSIWFEKSIFAQLVLLSIGALPIATLLMAARWQLRPTGFADLSNLWATTWQQRLRLNWIWLKPAVPMIAAFVVVYILSDVAIASLVAPSTHPTAMQVAVQFLSNYRFPMAASAMVFILMVISIIYSVAYAYRKPA